MGAALTVAERDQRRVEPRAPFASCGTQEVVTPEPGTASAGWPQTPAAEGAAGAAHSQRFRFRRVFQRRTTKRTEKEMPAQGSGPKRRAGWSEGDPSAPRVSSPRPRFRALALCKTAARPHRRRREPPGLLRGEGRLWWKSTSS